MTRPPRPNGSRRRASSGPSSVAAHQLGQHVAGEAALGRVRDPSAQQLERDDGDGLVQDEAVELRQPTGVLDRHEPGLRHPAAAVALGRGGDGQRERAGGELGMAGHEAARSAVARALAQLVAQGGRRARPRRARGGRCAGPAAHRGRRRRARCRRRRSASAPATASSPRSESTMRCRRSCAAIERCRTAYCSLTRRVNAFSVTAMNGTSRRAPRTAAGPARRPPGPSRSGTCSCCESRPQAQPGDAVVGEVRHEVALRVRLVPAPCRSSAAPRRPRATASGPAARRCAPSARARRGGPRRASSRDAEVARCSSRTVSTAQRSSAGVQHPLRRLLEHRPQDGLDLRRTAPGRR